MNQDMQPIFLTAKFFDVAFATDQYVGVVEVIKSEEGVKTQWWVSGFSASEKFGLLLQLQIALAEDSESGSQLRIRELVPTILALAKGSASVGGIDAPFIAPEPQVRKMIVLEHLAIAATSRIFDRAAYDLMQLTAFEYSLCTSFGLKTQIDTLAEFHGLPVSTISRRVARARDLGLISKPRIQKERNR